MVINSLRQSLRRPILHFTEFSSHLNSAINIDFHFNYGHYKNRQHSQKPNSTFIVIRKRIMLLFTL